MKVFINKTEVIIFKGATLGEAVLAFSKQSYQLLKMGRLAVFDRFGNLTEPDGPVSEGQEFVIRPLE